MQKERSVLSMIFLQNARAKGPSIINHDYAWWTNEIQFQFMLALI